MSLPVESNLTSENERAGQDNSQNLLILTIVIIFHVVLVARDSLAALVSPAYLGYTLLGGVFVLLCGGLICTHLVRNQPFKMEIAPFSTIFQANIQKNRRLFLKIACIMLISGIALRFYVIRIVPVASPIADMLPLIEKASAALHAGQNPYQVYQFPYSMPLTFLPGLWLPYYPLVVLGTDPRWLGLLIWLLVSFLLLMLMVENGQKRFTSLFFLAAAVNFALLQFSPELIGFHTIGHTFLLWLWLAFICLGMAKKQDFLTAFGLGLAIASRQTYIVLLPILLCYWYRNYGFRGMLKYSTLAAAVFFLLTLPFALKSPAQVYLAPITHYQTLAAWDLTRGSASFMANSIGFAYVIQNWLGSQALSAITAFVLAGICGLSWFFTQNRKRTLLSMAAALTLLNLFTSIPWTYIYYDCLILLAFALIIDF